MSIGKYTVNSAISCSVSYKDKISPEVLADILSGKKPLGEWVIHVSTLFNELPHDYLLGVMHELELSFSTLEHVYQALPPVLQGHHFQEFAYHG